MIDASYLRKGGRHVSRRALAFLALVLSACGRGAPPAPMGPPVGMPASALTPLVSTLNGADFPVYLPSRLPASSSPYQTSADATTRTYSVSASSGNVISIVVTGGPLAGFGKNLTPWTGPAEPTHLSDGTQAYFYPGQGLEWVQDGWRMAVIDEGGRPQHPDVLAPEVDRLRRDLPRFGNPIGPGTQGELVEHLGGDPPDMDVLWEDGGYAYEVLSHGTSGIDVAESLVRVRQPAVAGASSGKG